MHYLLCPKGIWDDGIQDNKEEGEKIERWLM